MRKAHFLTLIPLLLIVFLALSCTPQSAQSEVYVVGILNLTASQEPVLIGFKEGLAELGYVEGENVVYLYDGPTESIDGLDPALNSLLTEDVDLVLTLTTPATIHAKEVLQDTDIPILFAPINDPIASGIVDDLSDPGGNLTGIKVGGFIPKTLEWHLAISPHIKTVFAPYNPEDNSSLLGFNELQTMAEQFGVDIIAPQVSSVTDIEVALADIPPEADAIFMLTDSMILTNIDLFVATAVDHKLPLSSINSAQANAGALFAFGPEFDAVGKQAARLADQIFRGTQARDLPIETAGFYLTLNQQTAQAIELDIPASILTQADTIIR